VWKLIYEPLTGNFELRKVQETGGGGGAGGTVTSGTLQFPGGVSFELINGLATTGAAEITLSPGSTIVLLPL